MGTRQIFNDEHLADEGVESRKKKESRRRVTDNKTVKNKGRDVRQNKSNDNNNATRQNTRGEIEF